MGCNTSKQALPADGSACRVPEHSLEVPLEITPTSSDLRDDPAGVDMQNSFAFQEIVDGAPPDRLAQDDRGSDSDSNSLLGMLREEEERRIAFNDERLRRDHSGRIRDAAESAIEHHILPLRNEIDALKLANASLRQDLDKLLGLIDPAAQAAVDELDEKIAEMRSDLEKIDEEVADLDAEVAELLG